MNADGSGLHALIPPAPSTNRDYTLREPRYSPDGSQIAFQQWDDDRGRDAPVCHGCGRGEPPGDRCGSSHLVHRLAHLVERRDPGGRPARPRRPDIGRVRPSVRDHRRQHWEGHRDWPDSWMLPREWAPDDSTILLLQDIEGAASRQWLLDPQGGPPKALPWTSDAGASWQRLAP